MFSCTSQAFLQKNYDHNFELLNPGYDYNNIIVYEKLNKKKVYIRFIKYASSNCFVIKQQRGSFDRALIHAITETLSADIAQFMGITAQQVKILAAGRSFPGKVKKEWPATIHTLVPGCQLSELKESNPYYRLYIKQDNNLELPEEKLGLNRKVIANMSLHPDLAKLVALDTFLSSESRHTGNCFYDEKSDHFYVIDMDQIYNSGKNRALCTSLACYQIKRMLKNKSIKFSVHEIEALKRYKATLKKLIKNFPPKKLHNKMYDFAREAGFHSRSKIYSHGVKKLMFNVNLAYKEVNKLVIFLNKLICQHIL